MKKVLIISSSPRRGGNSDLLCDKFAEGAAISGNHVEKVFLRDNEINYCTGCGYCNSNDYTSCAKHDDMAKILDMMIDADVIVFATPIYFYSISGQMKTFIDRICARYPHICDKEFYYIMTAADNDPKSVQHALGDFSGLMSCLKNPQEKGHLFAGGVWQKGDVIHTEYMAHAYEMGLNV